MFLFIKALSHSLYLSITSLFLPMSRKPAFYHVPRGVNAELVTTYVAGGAMTLIGEWMRGRLDVSDDGLARQLVDLLPDWILNPKEEKETS